MKFLLYVLEKVPEPGDQNEVVTYLENLSNFSKLASEMLDDAIVHHLLPRPSCKEGC